MSLTSTVNSISSPGTNAWYEYGSAHWIDGLPAVAPGTGLPDPVALLTAWVPPVLDTAPIRIPGRVRDVAYYGDSSHVVVEAAGGLDLAVNVQNDTRARGAGVERGQNVWVHWSPEDSIVLPE